MRYKAQLSNAELLQIQRNPKAAWTKNTKVKPKEVEKHVKLFNEYLQTTYPVTEGPVTVNLYNSMQLPRKVSKDPQLGIANCWDKRADIHLAIKGKSIFGVLRTMAHEYWHCIQLTQHKMFNAPTHDLEIDAIDFQYDAVCQYLERSYHE